jgi:drug/metabolite transporter (DMT)-like permease
MQYLKNLGSDQKSVLYLIIANIIWGASFPIYKWTLESVPPFTFVFLRFFLAALIILPFVIKKLSIDKRDYKNLIILSLFSITFQIPLLFFGLKLTPSINAPIIIAFAPIILIISSIIFLKEKPNSKLIAGTFVSLMGVMSFLIIPLIKEGGIRGDFLGNLLIFAATICSVIQALILKKLTFRNDPLTITFWMFLIGSLPLIPFVIWESQSYSLITDLTFQGFIGILYGVYFAAILAHYLYAYGIKHIKASEVGIFSYVDPLATVAVAIPLLNETISASYLFGAMLVFLGIFIAEGRIPYHPFHRLFTKTASMP